MKYNIKKICFSLFLFLLLFSFDRISKVYAISYLKDGSEPIFYGLNLSLVFNRGISFGFLNFEKSFLFYSLSLVIFLVTIFFMFFSVWEAQKGGTISFNIFVLAGAYSNLLDRMLYGGVVDYIDFYIGSWHWPTFNMADIFIVVGIFGIMGRFFYNDYYYRKN